MTTKFGTLLGVLAVTVIAAAVPLTAGSAVSSCGPNSLPTFGPGASYHPAIDPARFGPNVDNPYFPLPPGETLVYSGTKDGKKATDYYTPSTATAVIDGVTTRVVNDRLYLNNRFEERTTDYYAQDVCGNVWYFGEDTAVLDRNGNVVDTSGSFHAGVDGAQPGVFMQAQPELGRRFRQEWYKGQAEDTFKATDLNASVTVPYGSFQHALRTSETTALEPNVVDNKVYVRGIGEVLEEAVKGPTEKLELVSITH